MFYQSVARTAIVFFRSDWKHKLCRERWDLAISQVLLNSVQRFQRSRKCLGQSEASAVICLSNRSEKHTLGRGDVRSCFLLSFVKRLQWTVENISVNQRQRHPSCFFFDRPEKYKLDRGYGDFASCQDSLNSVQWCQRRSRNCRRKSQVRTAILFFRSDEKTQTW